MTAVYAKDDENHKERMWRIFLVFLRLGLTSFGGPIAHIGYFRDEFVTRRRWLSERRYADLVALCQFLPGPASSQVGMALGLLRGGYRGAIAAWVGFTLPSAIALTLFALSLTSHTATLPVGTLHGLAVVAVAVVAQAVWGMARALCTDTLRISIMTAAVCVALAVPSALGQISIIALAALSGVLLFRPGPVEDRDPLPIANGHRAGMLFLALFFGLLIGLPVLASLLPFQLIADVSVFFRSGALVFGGGHVVLPLLQAAVVSPGWVGNDAFLAGYGAAQSVPGPLFTVAAFLGAAMRVGPSGWLGAVVCLLAIYAPSFLLVMGALPFWERLRHSVRTQAALIGINAAVVGLLLAALYHPVWTSAIATPRDFGLALVAFVALTVWRLPPWLVVVAGGIAGGLVSP